MMITMILAKIVRGIGYFHAILPQGRDVFVVSDTLNSRVIIPRSRQPARIKRSITGNYSIRKAEFY